MGAKKKTRLTHSFDDEEEDVPPDPSHYDDKDTSSDKEEEFGSNEAEEAEKSKRLREHTESQTRVYIGQKQPVVTPEKDAEHYSSLTPDVNHNDLNARQPSGLPTVQGVATNGSANVTLAAVGRTTALPTVTAIATILPGSNAYMEYDSDDPAFYSQSARSTPSTIGNVVLESIVPCPYKIHTVVQAKNIISLETSLTEDYKYGTGQANKFILSMIVHTVKGVNASGNNTGSFYKYANAKQNTRVASPYDRILLLADLTSKSGRMYAIIFATGQISHNDLAHHRHEAYNNTPFLGMTVAVISPIFRGNYLSSDKDIPIIELPSGQLESYVVPIKPNQVSPESPLEQSTPQTTITRWKRYESAEIRFFEPSMTTAMCGGIYCDRDKNIGWFNDTKLHCFCFYKQQIATAFLANRVDIHLKDTDLLKRDKDKLITIPNKSVDHYSSLRLLTLFFGNNAANNKADDFCLNLTSLQKHIKIHTKVVNKKGGWNIYGWYKYGEKLDAAMDDMKNSDLYSVISSTARFHIAYLYPANTDPDFLKSLKYTN